MSIHSYDLEEFIFEVYPKTTNRPRSEAVTQFSALCGRSYSTVYKWLKDESHTVFTFGELSHSNSDKFMIAVYKNEEVFPHQNTNTDNLKF